MKYQEMTVNDSFKTGDIWVDNSAKGGDDIILSCKTFGIRVKSKEIRFCFGDYCAGSFMSQNMLPARDSICRKVEREKNES